MKYVVYHTEYGCDTGCCGHAIEITRDDGTFVDRDFTFGHPYLLYDVRDEEERKQIMRAFAEKLLKDLFDDKHLADLDWENSLISYD